MARIHDFDGRNLMKVAQRLTLGYTVLILLPAILFGVQVFAFKGLRSVNQANSGDNLRAALSVLELMRDRDAVEDDSRRYFARADTASKDQLKESLQDFETVLRQIRDFRGSDRQQAELARLAQFWLEYNEALSGKEQVLQGKPSLEGFPTELADQLDRLKAQSLTVYQVWLAEMKKQAENSRQSSERIGFIAGWIGGAVLVFGVLISLLTVRSISTPLRNLVEGTHGIAEGKSFYRLDTSRNDEFSLIAKDFNNLAERLQGKAGAQEREAEQHGS